MVLTRSLRHGCSWYSLCTYGYWLLASSFPVTILLGQRGGRNSVPVLATLFLLSYAKLLRVIIAAFSFTTLATYQNETTVNSSKEYVWLYDGNVQYLQGKHIPLFVAALVIIAALAGPYTLMLIFVQCLQRSRHRVLFCVRRLKPLFDAYTGPYKDRHWPLLDWTSSSSACWSLPILCCDSECSWSTFSQFVGNRLHSCQSAILSWDGRRRIQIGLLKLAGAFPFSKYHLLSWYNLVHCSDCIVEIKWLQYASQLA